MLSSDVLSHRRDTALRRLRYTNRGLTAGATALLLAFAAIAARGFSGHSTAAAATTAHRAPTSSTVSRHADRHRSPPRPLARPTTAPKHRVKRHHAGHVAAAATTTSQQATPPQQTTTPAAPATTVSGGS
jgi:hypothetical protein